MTKLDQRLCCWLRPSDRSRSISAPYRLPSPPYRSQKQSRVMSWTLLFCMVYCIYFYIYVYTYTYIYTHMYIHTRMYTHTYIHTFIHAYRISGNIQSLWVYWGAGVLYFYNTPPEKRRWYLRGRRDIVLPLRLFLCTSTRISFFFMLVCIPCVSC